MDSILNEIYNRVAGSKPACRERVLSSRKVPTRAHVPEVSCFEAKPLVAKLIRT
jgi:hypothetical protein